MIVGDEVLSAVPAPVVSYNPTTFKGKNNPSERGTTKFSPIVVMYICKFIFLQINQIYGKNQPSELAVFECCGASDLFYAMHEY